jgi:hypothetical protein
LDHLVISCGILEHQNQAWLGFLLNFPLFAMGIRILIMCQAVSVHCKTSWYASKYFTIHSHHKTGDVVWWNGMQGNGISMHHPKFHCLTNLSFWTQALFQIPHSSCFVIIKKLFGILTGITLKWQVINFPAIHTGKSSGKASIEIDCPPWSLCHNVGLNLLHEYNKEKRCHDQNRNTET